MKMIKASELKVGMTIVGFETLLGFATLNLHSVFPIRDVSHINNTVCFRLEGSETEHRTHEDRKFGVI